MSKSIIDMLESGELALTTGDKENPWNERELSELREAFERLKKIADVQDDDDD